MTFLIVLYALHVLCGITWFGGAIYSLLVVGPTLSGLSAGALGETGPRLGRYAGRLMPLAAAATILLGIATAIATGRLADPATFLLSPYGQTACAALLVALGTYVWGHRVISGRAQRMQSAAGPEKPLALARLMQGIAIEQAGFLAIFGCMVLMRFGY